MKKNSKGKLTENTYINLRKTFRINKMNRVEDYLQEKDK